MGGLVEVAIDRGRLVEKIDQLQIDREYLEDSGIFKTKPNLRNLTNESNFFSSRLVETIDQLQID